MARLSRRKSTPLSPAKVVTESATPQVRRSTRTPSHRPDQPNPSTTQDPKSLDPVQEEGDTITVSHKSIANIAEAEELQEVDEESDNYSDWADEDLTDLDKDLIIDNLNAINVDVDDLFRLFNSFPHHDLFRDVQNPLSSTSKRLRHLSQRLINNLEPCGKDILLQAPRLSQFVSSTGDTSEVEKIFIKANLALTVVRLLQGRWHDQDKPLDDFLSCIAEIRTFPSPYLQQQAPDSSPIKFAKRFKLLTIKVGVSILTQWLIRNAEKKLTQDYVDPELLVMSVFFEDDHEQVRDVSLDSSSIPARNAVSEAINQRVAEIQRYFTQGEAHSIKVDELSERFPVQEMVTSMIEWTTERKAQLDQSIGKHGAIEHIRESLLKQQTTPDVKKKRRSKKSRESVALEAGAEFLRNLDGFLDERVPREETSQIESPLASRVANEIAETPQPDETITGAPQLANTEDEVGNVDIMNDDSNHDAPPSAQPLRDITQDMLDGADNIRAAANKENVPQQRLRLTERQPNARKEQFDSPEPPSRNTGKRAQRNQESEEEDDFEVDTRQQKRPRLASGRVNRPPPSIILEPETVDEDTQSSQNRPRSTPVHRNRPFASQPAPQRSPLQRQSQSPPPGTHESYDRVKQKAKDNMRMSVALNPSSSNPSTNLQAAYPSHQTAHGKIQVRRAWTPGEIERLLGMIAEYGTQWSKILKSDAELDEPMLQNRNQVQLKDKARNMKLDYLRAEMDLPPGFEGVTVSKAHKDAFRRLGIPVEEDIILVD